jgi:hypothetical protein
MTNNKYTWENPRVYLEKDRNGRWVLNGMIFTEGRKPVPSRNSRLNDANERCYVMVQKFVHEVPGIVFFDVHHDRALCEKCVEVEMKKLIDDWRKDNEEDRRIVQSFYKIVKELSQTILPQNSYSESERLAELLLENGERHHRSTLTVLEWGFRGNVLYETCLRFWDILPKLRTLVAKWDANHEVIEELVSSVPPKQRDKCYGDLEVVTCDLRVFLENGGQPVLYYYEESQSAEYLSNDERGYRSDRSIFKIVKEGQTIEIKVGQKAIKTYKDRVELRRNNKLRDDLCKKVLDQIIAIVT